MNQQAVRAVIDRLDLPVGYLKQVVKVYGIPPIGDRTQYHWQKLERLFIEPPHLEQYGWTYYEIYNTVVTLLEANSRTCRIRAPGMPAEKVMRHLCHHPYSVKAGGARRWNLEQEAHS